MTRAPRAGSDNGAAGLIVSIGVGSVALVVPIVVLASALAYDDPKAWALWLLAGATAVTWLFVRQGGNTVQNVPGRLLGWAVAAYALWWVLMTLLSVRPVESLFGSFGRGHGLLTVGGAVLLFFLVQAECRRPEALIALVDVALLGSVPVSLLAIGQALGWDPFPQPWDPAIRDLPVRSTFGQHIFLGSYLVLLIPVTAARLDWALRVSRSIRPSRQSGREVLLGAGWVAGALGLTALASRWPLAWWGLAPWGVLGASGWTLLRRRNGGSPASRLGVALLAALLAGEVLVLMLTRARGPLLGMLVGLGVTGGLLLLRRRAWTALGVGAAAFLAVVAFLALLNLPRSPLAPLRDLHALSRLARISDLGKETPGGFRLQLWRALLSAWGRTFRGEGVVPTVWPRFRSLTGYGLETQFLTDPYLVRPALGPRRFELEVTKTDAEPPSPARPGRPPRPARLRGFYRADRAHNDVLDHLLTGGLVGAGLWLVVIGGVLVVGVWRIRASPSAEAAVLRLGMLGAILGHLTEAQFGIATPTARALFWIEAAVLTSPTWSSAATPEPAGSPPRSAELRRVWATGAALLFVLLAWGSTRWLLGSVAYADGVRHGLAREAAAAREAFRLASERVPWLGLPAESLANFTLSLAAVELDPARRLALVREAEEALARSRLDARLSAPHWILSGQVAFALARLGDREQMARVVDAFERAARLKPDDPQIVAQLGLAWLERGDLVRAQALAREAVSLGPREWLGWAVLARAAAQSGDPGEARRAARRARRLAPPEAAPLVEALLR